MTNGLIYVKHLACSKYSINIASIIFLIYLDTVCPIQVTPIPPTDSAQPWLPSESLRCPYETSHGTITILAMLQCSHRCLSVPLGCELPEGGNQISLSLGMSERMDG